MRISFTAAPAVVEDLDFFASLSGADEVPEVDTGASGVGHYQLRDGGTTLEFQHSLRRLRDVVAAHLHLGAEGENGPVVAFLIPADLSSLSRRESTLLRRRIEGSLTGSNLTGPLAGQPLDALIAEIEAGNVYVNVHSSRVPSGELRGQVELSR